MNPAERPTRTAQGVCARPAPMRGAVAEPITAKPHGEEAAWLREDAGTKLVFDDGARPLLGLW